MPTAPPATPNPGPAILLVDDEPGILNWQRRSLERAGIGPLLTCDDSRRVMELVKTREVSMVLLDLGMPHLDGEELLRRLLASQPELSVMVVTGEHDISVVVRCMKLGAIDYLTKPLTHERFVTAVGSAAARSSVDIAVQQSRHRTCSNHDLAHPEAFAQILTDDPEMWSMFQYIETVARGTHPVFIWGETGTGKELVARALHAASGVEGPFIAVNVAGLDDALFSDTLFGHCDGAFTGTVGARKGMIEAAAGGTLFLDEIGDLSESSQVKLLRLLQEGEYYSIGANRPRALHARIVTATNRDPEDLRKDLYFRLRSYRVCIPPLRDRLSDLPILLEHFLRNAARDLGKRKPAVPSELFLSLSGYDYPGNVRELQALVFEAMARHGHGVLSMGTFLEHIRRSRNETAPSSAERGLGRGVVFPSPLPTLREIGVEAVEEALERTSGNRTAAARLLGISRPTITRHLRRVP